MLSIASIASLSMAAAYADDDEGAFLPRLVVSSTIPASGDLNPYGVGFVPQGFPAGGSIAPGDVLISNFNNSNNVQGTGTTIVKLTPNGNVAPAGTATTFFTGSVCDSHKGRIWNIASASQRIHLGSRRTTAP